MDSKATPYTPEPLEARPTGMISTGGDRNVRFVAIMERHGTHKMDAEDEGSQRLLTAGYNSYAKHFGPDAVEAAESDLLGEALNVLTRIGQMIFEDGSQPLSNVRDLLAKVKEVKP